MVFLGWLSAICFAICAYPQARKSMREGHSRGMDGMFLTLWLLGEITGIIYVSALNSWPLLVNYGLNLIFLLVITWYKVFPNSTDKTVVIEDLSGDIDLNDERNS